MPASAKSAAFLLAAFAAGLVGAYALWGNPPETQQKINTLEHKLQSSKQKLAQLNKDLDQSETQNQTLKQELNQAQIKLAQLETHNQTQDPEAQEKTAQTTPHKKEHPWARWLTPETMKEMANLRIEPLMEKLKDELGLSQEQAQLMAKLLKKKSSGEIDSYQPLIKHLTESGGDAFLVFDQNSLKAKAQDDATLKPLLDEAEAKRNALGETFTQEVSSLLSSEQLDKYKAYELTQAQNNSKRSIESSTEDVFEKVTDLSEKQKADITALYTRAYTVDPQSVKLGSIERGRWGRRRGTSKVKTEALATILTPAQMTSYQAAKQKENAQREKWRNLMRKTHSPKSK